MFWGSVVGKLAMTCLVLVSLVLFILTMLLLEFFGGLHVQEAEKVMLQPASKSSTLVEEHEDSSLIMEMTERGKDPTSRVIIYLEDGTIWSSETINNDLVDIESITPEKNSRLLDVVKNGKTFNEKLYLSGGDIEVMVIGVPLEKRSEEHTSELQSR